MQINKIARVDSDQLINYKLRNVKYQGVDLKQNALSKPSISGSDSSNDLTHSNKLSARHQHPLMTKKKILSPRKGAVLYLPPYGTNSTKATTNDMFHFKVNIGKRAYPDLDFSGLNRDLNIRITNNGSQLLKQDSVRDESSL